MTPRPKSYAQHGPRTPEEATDLVYRCPLCIELGEACCAEHHAFGEFDDEVEEDERPTIPADAWAEDTIVDVPRPTLPDTDKCVGCDTRQIFAPTRLDDGSGYCCSCAMALVLHVIGATS